MTKEVQVGRMVGGYAYVRNKRYKQTKMKVNMQAACGKEDSSLLQGSEPKMS